MNRFLTIFKWIEISLISLIFLTLAVVYGVSEYKLTRTYNEVPLAAITVPHDSVSIAQGKRLVGVYHCGSCHGEQYKGQEFLKVDMVATIIAPNLTTSVPTVSLAEREEILAFLTDTAPLSWKHINFQGEYDFAEETLRNIINFNLARILKEEK